MFNWLSLIVGFFYIVLGIVVMVYKFLIIVLEPNIAYAMGSLLILYGCFRMYRAYKNLNPKNDE
ncbi:MAG: C4-dicarboxylate ABC transporter [Bacteroidetes bacterium]|nr:C4-dicarboxylate ABC transporter [Bacteroidota bacterium]